MSINFTAASGSTMMAASAKFASPPLRGDLSVGGYLTDADIAMIKAATNTEFNWPPGLGEGVPEAALELSMLRLRQAQQGSIIGEINADGLQALHRAGLIDAEFLTNALKYLNDAGRNDAGAPKAPAVDLTRKSGSMGADGSIYL